MWHWFVGVAQAKFTLGLPFTAQAEYNTFGEYFTALLGFAIEIAIAISVIIFMYAGFLYAHSQGSPAPINTAKELVAGVLTGLAILFLIRLVTPLLGITVN